MAIYTTAPVCNGFYVMGSKEFLFEPVVCFSSASIHHLERVAEAMEASGYDGDIYILPASQRVKALAMNAACIDITRVSYTMNSDGNADLREES